MGQTRRWNVICQTPLKNGWEPLIEVHAQPAEESGWCSLSFLQFGSLEKLMVSHLIAVPLEHDPRV